MSERSVCPLCAAEVHNSYNGWRDHTDGPRHHLVAMGLSPEDAERVILVAADAGIAFEDAMAAVRYALTLPPEEVARKASELREFARYAVGSAVEGPESGGDERIRTAE